MKKISLIISLIFTSVTGILTSCSEDYPGPDPVDVTANYSNKFSNPNPTLTLVYNGENMTGKSVDFSTVKGETANLTFYDILPGEKALKLTHIPLTGDAEGYSFQGKGIDTTTQSTFNYEGRVVKGRLILNLADVTMANANLWAKNYRFADVEHGTGKVIADEGNGYQWEEKDDKMTSCAIYFRFPETEEATETSYNGQNMGSVLQGLLGYLLPCILKDITLEPDGNIIANYSGDAFNEENKDLFIGNVLTAFLNMDIEDQDMITDAIKDYQYTTSPKGLAYWFQRDGKIVIKLDLPAIISQVASGSGKVIDKNIISSISDAIFSMDALKLKSLLKTVNGQLQNEILGFIVSMNDQSFATFFDWLSNGIPMHIKIQNGHSYIYLDKEGIAPILKLLGDFHPIVLKMLPSLLPPEMAGLAGFLEPLIDMLFITWPECALLVQSFDLGLDLVPQN